MSASRRTRMTKAYAHRSLLWKLLWPLKLPPMQRPEIRFSINSSLYNGDRHRAAKPWYLEERVDDSAESACINTLEYSMYLIGYPNLYYCGCKTTSIVLNGCFVHRREKRIFRGKKLASIAYFLFLSKRSLFHVKDSSSYRVSHFTFWLEAFTALIRSEKLMKLTFAKLFSLERLTWEPGSWEACWWFFVIEKEQATGSGLGLKDWWVELAPFGGFQVVLEIGYLLLGFSS